MVNKNSAQYVFLRDSIYYYSRHIPKDIQPHYSTKRVVQSLKTKSKRQASLAASVLSARLDEYWLSLRVREIELPAAHRLKSQVNSNHFSTLPLISEAKQLYLRTKGSNKGKAFFKHTERVVAYVIESLGERCIDQYTSADAANFREWLKEKGLKSSSIQRNFSTIKAVINLTISECGLDCKNAFSGIYLDKEDATKVRHPISLQNIKYIQNECMVRDDDLRHLVALISDTGMRLSEAAGLMIEDIVINHDVPHVIVKQHPHRSLKTPTSKRCIPLIGMSLWAAKRLKDQSNSSYCFPRYASNQGTKSNSASAALNKWLKTVIDDKSVIHGFRHSFRDRLRAADAPTELIDQVGGWSMKSVGQSYGNGYDLSSLKQYMEKIKL